MAVAVLGGGIVGASAAFHLAKDGIDTVLVDSAITGRATSAGAGIVAPGTSMRSLPAFFELARPAVSYYPTLVCSLESLGFADHGYEVCGKLVVADTQEKADDLPRKIEIYRQRREDGMPNFGDITTVSPAQAQELLPTLGHVLAAVHLSGAARVDGAKMRNALTSAAERLGARIVRAEASLQIEGDRVVRICAGDEMISVDAVVVSTGAWINQTLAPTGFSLPIAPQKGQIIHIEMPDQDTTLWPILDWSGSQYQLSFGPNRVVCGATREFDSGYDTRVTAAGVQEVLNEQMRITPGIANGSIAEIRVGLRPYSDDGDPFIGAVPGFSNLFVSSGHGPSGLQLGPYSGLIGAELAQGKMPSADIESFRLDRVVTNKEVVY